MIIAQRFNAGSEGGKVRKSRRDGRKRNRNATNTAFETPFNLPSLRDLTLLCTHFPALKRRAILTASLRDKPPASQVANAFSALGPSPLRICQPTAVMRNGDVISRSRTRSHRCRHPVSRYRVPAFLFCAALICGHSFAAAEFDSLPAIYEYRAQDLKSLRVRFARPPRESAPWIYWMWFDNVVSKDEIKRELFPRSIVQSICPGRRGSWMGRQF